MGMGWRGESGYYFSSYAGDLVLCVESEDLRGMVGHFVGV